MLHKQLEKKLLQNLYMSQIILYISCGLLPGLLLAVAVSLNRGREQSSLRERLAAEMAMKRHFIDLATKHEGTVALLTRELHRLEVETANRTRIEQVGLG